VALTEALKLSKEQKVNIYTDSKYAFLILHAYTAMSKERGMLTTTGTTSHRDKKEITLIVLGIITLIAALAGINYGVIGNHVTAKYLTKIVEATSEEVGLAIKDMQRFLSSFACIVMNHCLALGFLLAKQGGNVPSPIPPVAHI
jgi:hypothetical protein